MELIKIFKDLCVANDYILERPAEAKLRIILRNFMQIEIRILEMPAWLDRF